MQIIPLYPQTSPLWLDLIKKYPNDVFHSPDWLNVLGETYGLNLYAAILLDKQQVPKAGIAFSRIEDIKSKRLVTLPFSDYCDPLIDNFEQWEELTEPLIAEKTPYTIRCVHNNIPLDDSRFELVKKAKWHGMRLDQNIDDLWSGLHSSSRRAIRKATREGVEVRVAKDVDELRQFYDLHRDIRKYKYRMVAQPYSFFENIWHRLIKTQKGLLMTAVHQETMIGGVLFLIWNGKLYYKFNASSQSHLGMRPNDLIIWEGIKYGKTKGLDYLDFGLSDWEQESLVRYKRKFATKEKTISILRNKSAADSSSQEQEINNLFPRLTDLFTDESVPDVITEKAGELLYRYFT